MARKFTRQKPILEDVEPLLGLAPWLGGKTRLMSEIGKRIDRIPHVCYAEPFLGLGAAFFGRSKRPKVEVVNDINGEVVNLFRVVRHHPRTLIDEVRHQPFSRAEFQRALRTDPAMLTDVQRASRFLFMQRARYRGAVNSKAFTAYVESSRQMSIDAVRRRLFQASGRLSKVTIENLPYQDFMRRYDRPATLFYLDPPYWGCEHYYGKDAFSPADFETLATLAKGLKGAFVMSINDVPEIRALFRGCKIETIQHSYSRQKMSRLAVTELLISGGRAA